MARRDIFSIGDCASPSPNAKGREPLDSSYLNLQRPCHIFVVLFLSSQMPNSFYCKACKLGFAVGWFHYHECPDGYGAETLLVCSACGTMHTIQHPAFVSIPVLGGLFHKSGKSDKTDRLLAQDGPLFANSPEDPILGHLKEWRDCQTSHDLCPKSKYKYMQDFIDLAPVKCHHCKRPFTLVKEWANQNVRCPGCGKPELSARDSWIT